jgi:hypothetical protein
MAHTRTVAQLFSIACAFAVGWIALAVPSLASAQDSIVQPAQSARERAASQQSSQATPEAEAAPGPLGEPGPTPVPAGDTRAASASTSTGSAAQPGKEAPAPPASPAPSPAAQDEREPSYSARAVVPPTPAGLREEQRIGSYAQPRWSATRRFPGTRVYVVPAGTLGIEWWLEDKQNLRELREVRYRSQYEFEMGLGHRLQLDLYLQTEQYGHSGPLQLGAEKAELRYALADWGVIPLNPTLYAEFVRQNNAPPKVELKLLLGDEIAPRWHMGFNIVFEHELGGVQENEYALTTGLSYTLADQRFALGAEVQLESLDHSGDRLSFDHWELLAGPSLAWSPVPPMHVLLAALLGNENESGKNTPLFEPTIVLGWEL